MNNRHKPHVIVVPEDDANRQLADGFVRHDAVVSGSIQVVPPAGGWTAVLASLQNQYVARLRKYPKGHVVLLIDFDRQADRRALFDHEIPDPLKGQVFVIGSWDEPEEVRRTTGRTLDGIGFQLADECFRGGSALWDSQHFGHNAEERARLSSAVDSFLFRR
ncbi:MAG: hypothetical protein BGO49_06660 [Planctomycetales bacterium 71-10]|nr:MAG: hypothetical protein BGO49_06660 [Planctomycetales bacterium 71-10]